MSRPVIAVYYYFHEEDLGNRIFSSDSKAVQAGVMRNFRAFMDAHGYEVVTPDLADFDSPDFKAAVYFDYDWRLLSKKRDPFLSRVPYEKRVLYMIEPAVVNPSLYYTSLLRRRFAKVLTWDRRLLRRNPEYFQVEVPIGLNLAKYRDNPFADIRYEDKKFLVAVSSDRFNLWPQSNFRLRKRVYRYMNRVLGDDFDLYGRDWRPGTPGWRGEIPGGFPEKVKTIAHYKFMICFENSVGNPGYISEKIYDCFNARVVPIYYGTKENSDLLPRGTFIDWRNFRSPSKLLAFLRSITPAEHARYLKAINDWMASPAAAERARPNANYEQLLRAISITK